MLSEILGLRGAYQYVNKWLGRSYRKKGTEICETVTHEILWHLLFYTPLGKNNKNLKILRRESSSKNSIHQIRKLTKTHVYRSSPNHLGATPWKAIVTDGFIVSIYKLWGAISTSAT